jgi:hypothetical protein
VPSAATVPRTADLEGHPTQVGEERPGPHPLGPGPLFSAWTYLLTPFAWRNWAATAAGSAPLP